MLNLSRQAYHNYVILAQGAARSHRLEKSSQIGRRILREILIQGLGADGAGGGVKLPGEGPEGLGAC